MRAILRFLFPHYRELEQRAAEEAGRVVEMQSQLSKLQEQNIDLERASRASRAEETLALKSVANVSFHLAGLLPPYPEAYQIPRRSPSPEDSGPVSSGRGYPRELVEQGKREFRDQLYGLKPERVS